ncbi:hypothetical protein TRVA0_024S00980 [Trichomonascus vanleenenianus]|uniref:uncharacterized protein n=1 Tax=Trichomonascus vanleenenianus TaxID=2268995 RepID=UPI003ECA4548
MPVALKDEFTAIHELQTVGARNLVDINGIVCSDVMSIGPLKADMVTIVDPHSQEQCEVVIPKKARPALVEGDAVMLYNLKITECRAGWTDDIVFGPQCSECPRHSLVSSQTSVLSKEIYLRYNALLLDAKGLNKSENEGTETTLIVNSDASSSSDVSFDASSNSSSSDADSIESIEGTCTQLRWTHNSRLLSLSKHTGDISVWGKYGRDFKLRPSEVTILKQLIYATGAKVMGNLGTLVDIFKLLRLDDSEKCSEHVFVDASYSQLKFKRVYHLLSGMYRPGSRFRVFAQVRSYTDPRFYKKPGRRKHAKLTLELNDGSTPDNLTVHFRDGSEEELIPVDIEHGTDRKRLIIAHLDLIVGSWIDLGVEVSANPKKPCTVRYMGFGAHITL